MRELSKIRLGEKTYHVDKKLKEIRSIENPHDAESVSPELIEFWEKRGRLEKQRRVIE